MRQPKPLDSKPLFVSLVLAFSGLAAAGAQVKAAAPLSGDSWEATRRAGKGKVTAAYYRSQGFAMPDERGQVTGVNADVFRQFGGYLKSTYGVELTIDWRPYSDFGEQYQAVRTGRGGVFGLAGVTVTEARKKEVAFLPSFFDNRVVLVTHSSVAPLESLAALPTRFAGFTALALHGTTLESRLQRLQTEGWRELKIEPVTTIDGITSRLAADPRTFAYLDLNMFWVARQAGRPLVRHGVADQPSEDLAFILPLGTDWEKPFAEFLAANGGYRNSRAYRQLLIKHLGVDVRELLDSAEGR